MFAHTHPLYYTHDHAGYHIYTYMLGEPLFSLLFSHFSPIGAAGFK